MTEGRKPNRPVWNGEPRLKFTTKLTKSTVAFLRDIGRGHANVGIERLEEAFRGTLRRQPKRLPGDHPRWKTARD